MEEVHLKCYRTACTNAADPRCWNRITSGMYCYECARLISENPAIGGPLFPYMDSPKVQTGQWAWPAIRVRKEGQL